MLDPKAPGEVWMDIDEAAAYYGVARRTIYKYCASAQLAFHNAPGGRKFLASDLDDLIRHGRVERRGRRRG